MSDSEIARITKLKGVENWSSWKFQVRVTLNAIGAWDIVRGQAIKPERNEDAVAQVVQAYERDLAAWTKADNAAQKIIGTSVEEKPLLHIINCETSNAMWEKLLSVYEYKNEASVHMLQQQWYNMKKDPASDIDTYISQLEDVSYRLKTQGENIPDSMLVTKLLMTLPSSFNHFLSAWESTPREQQTLTNLTSRPMMEEKRLNIQEKSEGNAFLAGKQYKGNPHHDNKKFRRPGKCFHCNKPGHWKRECRSLKSKGHETDQNKPKGDALIGENLSSLYIHCTWIPARRITCLTKSNGF